MKRSIWKKGMIFLFFLLVSSACGGMKNETKQESPSSASQERASSSMTKKSSQKEKREMVGKKPSKTLKKTSGAKNADTTSAQKAEASQQRSVGEERGKERIASVEESMIAPDSVEQPEDMQAPESKNVQQSEPIRESESAPAETSTSDNEEAESPTDVPYYYAEYVGGSEYFFSDWDEAMSWAQSILEDTSEGNLVDANGWTGWHGGTAIHNGVRGCGIEFY